MTIHVVCVCVCVWVIAPTQASLRQLPIRRLDDRFGRHEGELSNDGVDERVSGSNKHDENDGANGDTTKGLFSPAQWRTEGITRIFTTI